MIVEQAITTADITFAIAIMGAVGAVWARIENANKSVKVDISLVEKALAEFKLEVTRNYVRSENLAEMERRVLGHIENLTENVAGLRKDVMTAISRRRT